tara:strand:+ start:46 stop:204 length:159 start_codon:yes stop_codon:yes gene_type:complete
MVTLSVPKKTKKLMKKKLKEEQEVVDWSVKLQHASRRGRLNELKKKGLILNK